MVCDFYFLKLEETQYLFDIFEKNKLDAAFVGGCVRDAILGEKSLDFDLAINSEISKVINILKKENIKCILTGIKYNSITVVINNIKFELTSLRKDDQCFGRHCICSVVSSFHEDAKRRDFTINAIYVSKSGEVFDYFNGIQDLCNRKIKFIGNPEKRISEDYLRILRYYRFCAKYGDLEDRYESIIKKFPISLQLLSIERIQKELFQILESKYAIPILKNIKNSAILANIFNEMNIELLSKSQHNVSLEYKLFLLFSYNDLMTVFRLTKIQKQKIKEYTTIRL
ncbi:MAG: hypothetical protein LBE97_02345 [Holosporales bacterium]|nr:hypothetical protein [Holosporales bacterium]